MISYTSAYVDASGRRTQPPSVCDAETEEKRQRNRESVDIVFFVLCLETGNNKPTLFSIDADYFESLASTEENVSHRANEHFLNVFKKCLLTSLTLSLDRPAFEKPHHFAAHCASSS